MRLFVLLFSLCLGVTVTFGQTHTDALATRSTKVEGHLRCGKEPLVGAHIRLFRSSSEELSDVIASGKTDSKGRFSIEGDTARFQADASTIDPHINIYHKCDEAETKSGFRRVVIRYPRDFVTLGRIPRRTYNVGVLNMEFVFPKESRQKEIQGLS